MVALRLHPDHLTPGKPRVQVDPRSVHMVALIVRLAGRVWSLGGLQLDI